MLTTWTIKVGNVLLAGHPLNTLTNTHVPTLTHELETWDPRSLSRPFVTPTANLNARARELELDIGTFRPNQYKSCVHSLHYHSIL